jgi:glutamate--cysteine ligase
VRSLDINPFSPIGVDEQQVRFLDLFMVWCVLADAPEMSSDELLCTRTNWNRVILEGRKPGLTLGIGCETAQFPLTKVGKDLFRDLKRVARRWTASTAATRINRSATSWWNALITRN